MLGPDRPRYDTDVRVAVEDITPGYGSARILRPDEVSRGLTPLASPVVPPDNSRPGLLETAGAAFGLHNDVVNAVEFSARDRPEPDPNYDVFSDPRIKGSKYEANYLDNFVASQSAAETSGIMARIEREERLQQIYARSGTIGGILGFAAGVLSPTTLIPVAGWFGKGVAASRALRAGEVALASAGGAAASEAVMQSAQETRTAAESAFAITGAALLGGVLGSLARGMPKAEFDGLAKIVDDHLASPSAGVGAAAAAEFRGSGEQVASGLNRALRLLTPKSRVQTSEEPITRNVARDIIAGNALRENAEGIASSVGGSVEARMGAATGAVADVAERYRVLYKSYRQEGGKFTFPEFREEISKAALAGDEHAIPQIAEAAKYRRSNLVDPLRDDAMAAIKGLKEMVEAGSADQSYLTRMWLRPVVRARFNELVDILADHFSEKQAEALERVSDLERRTGADEWAIEASSLTKDEIRDLAKDTVTTLMGAAPNRLMMPGDLVKMKRGPLAERLLSSLPTTKVLDFVEKDVERIDHFYSRTMTADTNLTKKFGSVDMVDQLQKIQDAYNARKAGKSEAEQIRLQNAADADKRDIAALRDITRGTYRLPSDPEGMLYRSVQAIKTLNFLSSLGMMTVSAMSDLAKPIMRNGLLNLKIFTPYVRGLQSIKIARKDAKLFGAGIDMITGDRVLEFNELTAQYANGTKFERGLQQAGRMFGFITLMNPWNAAMKQFSGVVSMTRALEGVEALAKGTIDIKERAYLAENGIDGPLAERIFAQFEKHGGADGAVRFANAGAWEDRYAREALGALVNREVNNIIVTPGVGDRPLLMHTQTGQLIGQFQSFAFASIQRTLIAGMQQRDAAFFGGVLLSCALGALSYLIKSVLAGVELSSDPGVWASEAIDNSGVLGILMNADHAVEKVTHDRLGLSALTGVPARRYLNVNPIGSFLGPTFGKASDAFDVAGALSTGSYSASDTHKLRKMLPLQNLLWLRLAFNAAEEGFDDALGIQPRQ